MEINKVSLNPNGEFYHYTISFTNNDILELLKNMNKRCIFYMKNIRTKNIDIDYSFDKLTILNFDDKTIRINLKTFDNKDYYNDINICNLFNTINLYEL